MKKLAALLMCSLVAAPAMAGEDSTDRYWGYGPAWYETECGLACFRLWELSGGANDVTAAALKRVETTAQLRRLIDPPH